jgi:putative heme-binding domain-containing protein
MPNWDEDLLLPRQWDGGGHAAGIHAPGGWICKIDPEGKTWDVFSSGYRNQFDFAFNADGEMFVYDADMEWDFGSPWYRPTRVVHATSGSEFGWRNGTGKWPSYYVDSLPPVIDIGPGCPVGVEFGYGTKFPGKYQKSLFVCDWTFGTMYAIHIEPSGSSYQATKEEFLSRTPLPLTDCTVGKDGALYFTTGGRGSQSELFRITYMGTESTSPVDARDTVAKSGSSKVAPMTMRAERQDLERYHVGVHDPKRASEAALSSLGSSDRHLSTAARVALERIPVAVWQDAIFTAADLLDTAPNEQHRSGYCNQVIHGCVGLARQADPDALPQILTALGKLDLVKLNEQQQLGVLRAYQLALIRLGEVDGVTFGQLSAKFDRLFPSEHALVNRELAILMIFFRSPNIQAKLIPILQRDSVQSETNFGHLLERNTRYGAAIAAMLLNQPDQNQYHYAFHLRTLKTNWTMADRQIYFSWFDKARKWSGGASYPKFLANIDDEAFALLSDADRLKLESNGSRKPYLAAELPKAIGPGRDYTLNELVAVATEKLQNRDFKNGKKMFGAARCVVCHRFGHEGGATGPDLTQLAGRFTLKDLTEAIVDPSKVISDQFKAVIVETKKGMSYTGKMVRDSKESITLVIDPENATKVLEIHKSDIAEQQVSLVSLMPKDLLKTLNQDEVLDLLAYLLSRGDAKNAMFQK